MEYEATLNEAVLEVIIQLNQTLKAQSTLSRNAVLFRLNRIADDLKGIK